MTSCFSIFFLIANRPSMRSTANTAPEAIESTFFTAVHDACVWNNVVVTPRTHNSRLKEFAFISLPRAEGERHLRHSLCDLFHASENESVKNSSQTVQSKSTVKVSSARLHFPVFITISAIRYSSFTIDAFSGQKMEWHPALCNRRTLFQTKLNAQILR